MAAGALIVFVYIFQQIAGQVPVLASEVTEEDVSNYLNKWGSSSQQQQSKPTGAAHGAPGTVQADDEPMNAQATLAG